ncbi:MAG: tetratricopeptide repeat protein [Pseudomonadota bacterium]|nr:tetratricopeptide repeat protein [Pseudomonadota bacterium]
MTHNEPPKWHFLALFFGLMYVICHVSTAQASPYRPTNPDQVLEKLPRDFPQLTLDPRTVAQTPSDVDAKLSQIQKLLEYAYLQGDPRALGQATALLQRHPMSSNNVPLLMLRAQAAQANHQFAEATKFLKQVTQQQPNHSEAYLQLASIELVSGHFNTARQSCELVRGLDALVLRLVCLAQVDAMTGKLADTAAKLQKISQLLDTLNASQQLWVQLIQADIALRLNDKILMAKILKQLPTNNVPALTARADWLMAQGQWQKVYDLLKNHTEHEGLLIRWLTSKHRLKHADAIEHQKLLTEKIAQWRRRNDQAHYREQASYALLAESAKQSLNLARENWKTQRETADMVIYATAALRSKSQVDIQALLDWADSTRFEYPIVLQRLIAAQNTIKPHTQDRVK